MARAADQILVIAAHPDDEVLGCGGTLLKWRDAGHQITVAFAGAGREGGAQADEAEAVARRAGWRIWDPGWKRRAPFRDNAFGPLDAVIGWVETVLSGGWMFAVANQRTRILIHGPRELNQDHAILRQACLIACRPFAEVGRGLREVWAFEVPGSTDWGIEATIYFDVGAHWKRKVELVELYASERRKSPHPRSVTMLEARAAVWGSHSGLGMAEAFRLERWVIGQTSGTAA